MKKIIIIVVALVVLLGGAGAGLFFTGIIGGGTEAEAGDPAEGEAKNETASVFDSEPVYLQLDPLTAPVIVNRRVSAQVILILSLQVKDLSAKDDITSSVPRLRDAMLRELYDKPVVREQSDGSIDIIGIKARMLKVAQSIYDTDQVLDVLVVKAVQTG